MEDVTPETVTSTEQKVGPEKEEVLDLTGKKIGDYQLLRRLGQGGMGQVYLAEQISLKRKVALKLLRSDLAANSAALQRFKREAEAVARATHANIVQVYAIGDDNGLHFMVLEYVEGRNLRDYLEKKGPPEPLISISILRQVASALQRASELGVIHRDIKPENILLTRKGEVKVADFGLSRIYAEEQPLNITQSGVTMGTPLYMSPEQVEGKPLDPRTDIYSLGVTAYHLLAGEPPFRGQTPFEVAVQHVQKDPFSLLELRPDLPPDLCAMIHKMMAKKPEERYQTAHEIVRDLSILRDQLVGLTTTNPAPSLVSSGFSLSQMDHSATTFLVPAKPHRLFSTGLAIAILLLLVGSSAALGVWWKLTGIDSGDLLTKQEALDPEKKEEEEWLKQFRKNEKAQNLTEIGQGMYAAVKLAGLYLNRDLRNDPKEMKETEAFFLQLRQKALPTPVTEHAFAYVYFGRLGEAIVLAFQDEPIKSNELFVKLVKKKSNSSEKPPSKDVKLGLLKEKIFKEYLVKNYDFRKTFALALQRNYENDPEHFPSQLEPYRLLPVGTEPKKITKMN